MAQKTITDLRNLDALASSLLFAVDGDTETFNITLDSLFNYIVDRKGDIETGVIEMYMGETVPVTHTELDGKTFDPLVFPKMGALFPDGILPDTRGMILKHAPDGRAVLSFEAGNIKSHTHSGTANSVDLGTRETTLDGVHNHGYGDARLAYVGAGPLNAMGINPETDLRTGDSISHKHSVSLGAHGHTLLISNSGGSENLVDNIAVKFIIKKA